MKVNFDHRFVNESGKDIRIGTKDHSTLKDVALAALLNAASQSARPDGSIPEPDAREKRMRFDLAVRIKNFGNEAVIQAEEADLINRCIGTAYHTMIAGPASYLLEGKEPPSLLLKDPEPKQAVQEPQAAEVIPG